MGEMTGLHTHTHPYMPHTPRPSFTHDLSSIQCLRVLKSNGPFLESGGSHCLLPFNMASIVDLFVGIIVFNLVLLRGLSKI
jgi:hypothetical protein